VQKKLKIIGIRARPLLSTVVVPTGLPILFVQKSNSVPPDKILTGHKPTIPDYIQGEHKVFP
jgi:hypothetical protein